MAELATFRRELDVYLDETLGEKGRRDLFVGIARDTIADFEADWRASLGQDPSIEVFVDGVSGAPLSSVTMPGGTISARVQPIGPIVDRALELFDLFTKVVTGGYKADTVVFVNDAETSSTNIGPEDRVVITNLSPFARKGEVRGFNDEDHSGFRNGLFEGIATILKQEFRGYPVPIAYVWRRFGGRDLPALMIG